MHENKLWKYFIPPKSIEDDPTKESYQKKGVLFFFVRREQLTVALAGIKPATFVVLAPH